MSNTPPCPTAAILQRVLSASVTVEKELVSSIGKGILVFAAMAPGDTEKDAESLASKILKLKMWDDENGGRVCGLSCPSDLDGMPTSDLFWHLKVEA